MSNYSTSKKPKKAVSLVVDEVTGEILYDASLDEPEDVALSACCSTGKPVGDRSNASAEARSGQRDLTNINKVSVGEGRAFRIKNRETGEIIELYPELQRVRRMQKRVFGWADALKPALQDTAHHRVVMLGLTYAKIEDWRPNHIRKFMLCLRKVLGSNLLGYAWVAELQKRGAVHYHVLVVVKSGTNVPMPDKTGMWTHGNTRRETARTHYYIASYVGKEYQKMGKFPKGLRMYAVWVAKSVVDELRRWELRLTALPGWFQTIVKSAVESLKDKWVRVPGGGWAYKDTLYQSPYQFLGIG
jgi:hypothetical protein